MAGVREVWPCMLKCTNESTHTHTHIHRHAHTHPQQCQGHNILWFASFSGIILSATLSISGASMLMSGGAIAKNQHKSNVSNWIHGCTDGVAYIFFFFFWPFFCHSWTLGHVKTSLNLAPQLIELGSSKPSLKCITVDRKKTQKKEGYSLVSDTENQEESFLLEHFRLNTTSCRAP